MAKVKDPTWEKIEVSSPDGDYPITLVIYTRYYEAGVTYIYWGTSFLTEADVVPTEVAALLADIDEIATA